MCFFKKEGFSHPFIYPSILLSSFSVCLSSKSLAWTLCVNSGVGFRSLDWLESLHRPDNHILLRLCRWTEIERDWELNGSRSVDQFIQEKNEKWYKAMRRMPQSFSFFCHQWKLHDCPGRKTKRSSGKGLTSHRSSKSLIHSLTSLHCPKAGYTEEATRKTQ
jgi:hypothetical protein